MKMLRKKAPEMKSAKQGVIMYDAWTKHCVHYLVTLACCMLNMSGELKMVFRR